jgi:hypothetical protein
MYTTEEPSAHENPTEWWEYRLNGHYVREYKDRSVAVLLDGAWELFDNDDAAEVALSAIE